MESFGATLKKEREERGLTLDTVAAVIGIDRGSLSALERDEFDGLPDHEAMLRGLRSYADCLQVDAELMIQHYEQERERCLQRLADAVAERAVEASEATEPYVEAEVDEAATVRTHAPRRGRRPIIVLAPLVAMVALGAWWLLGRDTAATPVQPIANEAGPAAPTEMAPQPVAPPAHRTAPPAPAAAVERPAPAPTQRINVAASMGVTEYGVGTGVRSRQLVGRSERFALGSRAWFWTRVEGGASGERIEHVWLHEGVEAARIELGIGGRRWRTQSSKTLRSPGAWTVEARDRSGRVLARTEFLCVR